MERSGPTDARRPSRRGRRARRLRLTVVVCTTLLVLGAATAGWVYVATRPEPYRPGEEESAITRALSRGLPAEAPALRFRDVTADSGLDGFVQFVGGRTSQLPEDMGSGAAWGDFDNDGDDDLFVVSAGGSLDLPAESRAPSRLYENRGDGVFREVEGFPETRIVGMGAAWGDYDADGRLDLVVTGYGALRLFRNGPGGFAREQRLPELQGFWAGAAWGDYDRDGDLDLYVCGYVRYEEDDAAKARATLQYGRSVPYTLNPASYQPERNLLFRNDFPDGFREVAAELGVDNTAGRSLGALWHDFDGDGWLDLYVANDISDNVLYRNVEGRFEEISHAAWVADYRGAMGLAAGDWDRDGDDDLFISHWVAQENALYDSQVDDLTQVAGAQAAPSAATLRFMDVADQVGLGQIALRDVGWGAEFADLDGDGWLDLVVANGSTFETDDSPPRLQPQKPFVFWNERGKHFYDLVPGSGPLDSPHVARGLALADFDGDGDLDLLFVRHGEGLQLLRNEMQAGNWVEFRLHQRTRGRPGFGDGARLIAHVGTAALRRSVGGASYLSQSSRTIHVGLGSATSVDRLEVRWPDGQTQAYERLTAGTTWELNQGDPVARPLASPSGTVASAEALDERAQVVTFWTKQRAAMEAIKLDGDLERAVDLFREALAIRPDHEDSRYYLANCLENLGHPDEAIAELRELTRISPQSHRGFRQLGVLLAMHARSADDLASAREALERSLAINREETGSLLALGEIALLQDDTEGASRYLSWACRTNPRAVGGFWLQAYLAWREGDPATATELLQRAASARGEGARPNGFTAEGDVRRKQHDDETPLSRFWETWEGSVDPREVFAPIERHLHDRS